ncbi:PQQ-binding-like beta-propeller repeat protein [Streptomyces sp. DH12]|uniref:serine/threonine-protein kinase n=1 Tax=Streptomyces sp. DH12 TaxID=2857010 RepID=UPI001E430712|nr:serine/threonine-protein kinase [Streptomyces sp. DH12]
MPPLRSSGPVPEAEHPEYAGRYRLGEWLGSGGMGDVRLAASDSGLRLAVKVVHREHAADPEFRARFRQEVSAARRVSGAFTAPVVDADPQAARPWMATLYIDGPTLSERVKRNGPLGAEELRRLGAGLAEALRDIHRAGVVHRDLKPSNVLLAADGPKVIDFGISRPTDSDVRTETGKLIGTPPFMAPEQFQRPRDVGPAADVFAMGAVLVHAATGRGPFDSDSPYVVAYQVVHNEPDLAGVPEELAPLLVRCLAKDPAERPAPEEVMGALRVPGGGSRRPVAGGASGAGGDGRAADGCASRVGGGTSGVGGGTSGEARVPAPRGPVGGAAVPDGGGREGRAGAGPDPGREGVRGSALPRRRLVWGAAAVALAAAVAGAVLAVRGFGDRGGARDGGPVAVAAGFRPWAVALGEAGGGARPPVCAGARGALYCAAPGVKAARLAVADGARAWSVPAVGGAAASGRGEGAAVLPVGGVVLVVGADAEGGAEGGARLEALDPATGAVRWQAALGAYAQVVPGADMVLAVLPDGRVRALDAATGAERWAGRPAARGAQWVGGPRGPLFAAAVAADGATTLVTAVDPVDGRVLWRERVRGSLTPVQATERGLVLLSADADLYTDAVVRLTADAGTDPAAGAGGRAGRRVVTRVALGGPVDQAQAVADGDAVYVVGSGGSLTAVDLAVGREQWRLETGAARVSRPVVADGRVLLMAGDGRLLAVDAGRRAVVGQTAPRMAGGGRAFVPLLPAPVVVDGKVVAGAPDGAVFAVDPAGW